MQLGIAKSLRRGLLKVLVTTVLYLTMDFYDMVLIGRMSKSLSTSD
jgi:hypothetical protein